LKAVHFSPENLPMKSQGEIEAAVCDGVSRLQQEFLGRGPEDIRSHLLESLLVVRLQGVLTPAERRLMCQSSPVAPPSHNGHDGSANDNGRHLVKQVRSHVMSVARPRLAEIVETITGVKLISLHHDISTVTGEELLVLSLDGSPACRPSKKERKGDR
jgi:uncharacterized protein YbcI